MTVETELQRRRELARMSKPDLITVIIELEAGVEAATRFIHQVETAFGDQP